MKYYHIFLGPSVEFDQHGNFKSEAKLLIEFWHYSHSPSCLSGPHGFQLTF